MNQPPPTEKQTGKRIVSKGEYAAVQAKRAGINLIGLCLLILMPGMVLAAILILFGSLATLILIYAIQGSNSPHIATSGVTLCQKGCFLSLILGGLAYPTYKLAITLINQTRTIDPGIPLTRANTADLPAPDSLVRASTQPVQEPQAMLLRAATEASERQEEPLVRASAGGTEQV